MASARPVTVDRPRCEICCDYFLSNDAKRQTRNLPCGHTFCLGCLQDLLRTSPMDGLTCPTCRAALFAMDPATLIALPRVYALEGPSPPDKTAVDGMEISASSNANGTTTCENDGCPSLASLFCMNCNSAFCQGCDAEIHLKPVLKKHTRVDIVERPLLCPDHHEAMTLYCSQDEVLVCSECIRLGDKHGGHLTKHVDDVAAIQREQLRKKISVLEREKERIAGDLAAIDKKHRALADEDATWREEIDALEQRMRRDLQQLFVRLGEDAGRTVAEGTARLAQDQAVLRALQEEIEQSLALAQRAWAGQGRSSNARLVHEGLGQRLEEVAERAQAAGFRPGKRGRVELDLDGVQQVAVALGSLATDEPRTVLFKVRRSCVTSIILRLPWYTSVVLRE